MSIICELAQKKMGAPLYWNRPNTGASPAEMTVANIDSPPAGAPVRTASPLLNRNERLRPAIGPAKLGSSSDTLTERLPVGTPWSDKLAPPTSDWRAPTQRLR